MKLMTAALLATLALVPAVSAQTTKPLVETTVAPGPNYDKANFRLWLPPGLATVKAVLVLVPGSNGDGRPMVSEAAWQDFAVRRGVALVGCEFTDKPHDQGFIEEYVNVSRGSGQALLDALAALAAKSSHPELAQVPLLFWGMSAGGQFNYEFAAWKPERVLAFVVNKGGIYYSALVPGAARRVPALLFVGGKDLAFRTNTIVGLFAVNRRAGALWALVEEPKAEHVVGRSQELSLEFFDEVMPLRLGEGGALRPLSDASGFLGDLTARTFAPRGTGPAPGVPTAWLPTERVARAWQAVVTDTAVPK